MGKDYQAFRLRAGGKKERYRQILKRLKKLSDSHVDWMFAETHTRVFEEVDCLTCAFCCRYTGPRWTRQDIRRVSSELHMKEGQFESIYLHIDEDGDYVFKSMPCPFLLADNKCSIYEVRPKACREYPHSDRKKMKQVFDLTLKNSTCCPAVEKILDSLSSEIL